MIVTTRDFGSVEINEEDIITFAQPIFGFEHLSKFVFLFNEEISDHFVWLQSLEDDQICFVLANPSVAINDYTPNLPGEVIDMLGEGDYLFWLVVVVAEDFINSTINLKSPIVICPATKLAAQIILEENLPIRYPLRGEGEGDK